jgi:hypothetical protein
MAISQPHFPSFLLELCEAGLHASTRGDALSVNDQVQVHTATQALEEPAMEPWMVILESSGMNLAGSIKLRKQIVVQDGLVKQFH